MCRRRQDNEQRACNVLPRSHGSDVRGCPVSGRLLWRLRLVFRQEPVHRWRSNQWSRVPAALPLSTPVLKNLRARAHVVMRVPPEYSSAGDARERSDCFRFNAVPHAPYSTTLQTSCNGTDHRLCAEYDAKKSVGWNLNRTRTG